MEDPGNYRLIKLISVVGKVIEINPPGNLFQTHERQVRV